jgi:putative tricarboxylic transport membrane protein
MIKAKRDCINALVIVAFAAVLFFAIDTIPDPGIRRTGPAFFPRIVVPALGILGLVLLLDSIRRMLTERQEPLVLDPRVLYRNNHKIIFIFLACGAYIPALYYLGYLIATPFFLLGVYLFLAKRTGKRFWAVILGYLLFTVLLYVVFQQVLYVFLPAGQL